MARRPSRAHVSQTDPCEKESRSHRNQHRSLSLGLPALSVKSVFLTRPSSASPFFPPQCNPSYKLSGTWRRHRPTLKLDLSLSPSPSSRSLAGRRFPEPRNQVTRVYTQYTHSIESTRGATRWGDPSDPGTSRNVGRKSPVWKQKRFWQEGLT